VVDGPEGKGIGLATQGPRSSQKKKKRGGLLISQQEAFGYEANAQQEKKCSRIERGIFF
jgi:hypothetical protein